MPHLFLIFCLFWSKLIALVHQAELHIVTTSGIINGKYNNTARTVRGFIGIPYAEPPVGRLRWAPPRPKSPQSPIDASSFSNPCAQVYTYSNESIWSILPYKIWNAADMSEDCLYMNIWTPSIKHQNKKKPKAAVMMFIHGGSYASGSGSVGYYDGTNLVQDNEDIIVVTFK
jgi:carboxylesterase type B